MEDYNHFAAIVAGENANALMLKYDKNKKVKPYVVYKYDDAALIQKRFLDIYRGMLTSDLNEVEREDIKATIEEVENLTPEDFFLDYTEDYAYDKDTGDAISDVNPDGKWKSYRIGKMLSVPFITKDGREVFSARKNEIDWSKIHLNGKEVYESAWDLVMENKTPETDLEKQIYENMKNRTAYFEKFGNKENYVISCTAFWGYAFVSEKDGWEELNINEDQFAWMKNYYDKYIVPLPDDTLLTIFECIRD